MHTLGVHTETVWDVILHKIPDLQIAVREMLDDEHAG